MCAGHFLVGQYTYRQLSFSINNYFNTLIDF